MEIKQMVCIVCNLWEPHIDEESSKTAWAEYINGKLIRKCDNCSKWLCNDGACPNDNYEKS
jgi:hypothetical protein